MVNSEKQEVKFLKVKYRGMYLQKGAKMLLFAVTDIITGSYEVTFW